VDHCSKEHWHVKADPFVQLRLLDLQSLDSTADRLAHKRKTLPEIAEIDRLDGLLSALRNEIVMAEASVQDLQRELDKGESDIEQVRVRKARDEERLASGVITVPKQLEELQHEIQTLVRRQSELEDAELEVMERMEEAQGALTALVTERDDLASSREAAVAARDKQWEEIDLQLRETAADRGPVAAALPDDLLALYEKIRAAEGGVGAGAVERGRCGACHLDLMQNEKAEFRAAAPDDVLRHDECRRILIRTAESGL
jgi:predicted  nucleic acid-binding Zn-ribbon protein